MRLGTIPLKVGGLKLHYTRTGGNRPALVLAHGFSDDGLCWTRFAEALEETYEVIMVDAYGHGRSGERETPYGPVEQAADLVGVIKGLGLERPLILGNVVIQCHENPRLRSRPCVRPRGAHAEKVCQAIEFTKQARRF